MIGSPLLKWLIQILSHWEIAIFKKNLPFQWSISKQSTEILNLQSSEILHVMHMFAFHTDQDTSVKYDGACLNDSTWEAREDYVCVCVCVNEDSMDCITKPDLNKYRKSF